MTAHPTLQQATRRHTRHHARRGLSALLWLPLLLAAAGAAALPHAAASTATVAPGAERVHTVFLTDCTAYSDWQTLAMVFAWRASGQAGSLTRVMCCTPEERAAYRKDMLSLVPTHVAPSYARRRGDEYAAYNKPGGVIDWLSKFTPEEEWVVVLDSDMMLRRPFSPSEFKLSRGLATGARYDYLIGVTNDLAVRHIPEVKPINDTAAGPEGRRGDRVGGFYFIHRDDLKQVAPLWLKYAEDVRADPEAWHLSGDFYSKNKGDRPWISEMYGYVFGAAKLGIRHKWDEESMIYPGYTPVGVPRILHYGLLWNLEYEGGKKWSFDKHWFTGFDMTVCPPWDIDIPKPQAGLFPAPPRPSQLRKNATQVERYTDLISIEVVATLNAALCEYHMRHCTVTNELLAVCREASAAYEETAEAVRAMDAEMGCTDHYETECQDWAKSGECEHNPGYMHNSCRLSCKLCTRHPSRYVRGANGLATELARFPPTLPPLTDDVNSTGAAGAQPQALPTAAAAGAAKPPPPHNADVDVKLELPPMRPREHTGAALDGADKGSLHAPRLVQATKKELLRRCYKWTGLTMEQVKQCAHAAERGFAWDPEDLAAAAGHDSSGDTASSSSDSSSSKGGSSSSGDGGGGSGGKHAGEHAASSVGGVVPEPAAHTPASKARRISLYGALMAWFGIVGMFLSVLPRLYARGRRRPSAPDHHTKLSV